MRTTQHTPLPAWVWVTLAVAYPPMLVGLYQLGVSVSVLVGATVGTAGAVFWHDRRARTGRTR